MNLASSNKVEKDEEVIQRKVTGPCWVVEIHGRDKIVGEHFSMREKMREWIKGQRGELDISYVESGESMTYIKSAPVRKPA